MEGEQLSEIPKTGAQLTKSEYLFYQPAGKILKILFQNNGLEDFFVINGRKTYFDPYLIPRGESKVIKLRPDVREKHEFGVVPAVNTEGVPVGNREFPATMFELPKGEGGKMVRIEGNKGGPTTTVTLVRANNEELPLERIGYGPLLFREAENFSQLMLLNWLKEGQHCQIDLLQLHLNMFQVSLRRSVLMQRKEFREEKHSVNKHERV